MEYIAHMMKFPRVWQNLKDKADKQEQAISKLQEALGSAQHYIRGLEEQIRNFQWQREHEFTAEDLRKMEEELKRREREARERAEAQERERRRQQRYQEDLRRNASREPFGNYQDDLYHRFHEAFRNGPHGTRQRDNLGRFAEEESWKRQQREYRKRASQQREQQRRDRRARTDGFYQSPHDCFVILGIPSDSPKARIKKRFHELAKKYHPDKGGDAEMFKKMKAAYEHCLKRATV